MKCPRISVLKEMNWVGKWKSKPQTPLGPDQLNNWSRMKFEELEDPSSSWPNVKRKLWNNYSLDWWWIQEKIPSIFYSHIHHAKHWCLPAGETTHDFAHLFSQFSIFSFFDIQLNKEIHSVWKSPEMSHWSFSFLAFSSIFDLSGNTVKCKCSSLRSQCWMRLFSVIFKHCEHCCFLLSAILKGKLQSYFSIDSNFPSLYDAIIFEHMYMCDNFPKC